MKPLEPSPLKRIVSGGQTGVDRAALDVAVALQIPHGGWCPRGRLAEDGPIDPFYNLREHDSADYADRTRRNVIDSDGTLILYVVRLSGGTALTNRIAKDMNKPLHRIRIDHYSSTPAQCHDKFWRWLHDNDIQTLNIAGPRESNCPGLYDMSLRFLTQLLTSPTTLLFPK